MRRRGTDTRSVLNHVCHVTHVTRSNAISLSDVENGFHVILKHDDQFCPAKLLYPVTSLNSLHVSILNNTFSQQGRDESLGGDALHVDVGDRVHAAQVGPRGRGRGGLRHQVMLQVGPGKLVRHSHYDTISVANFSAIQKSF